MPTLLEVDKQNLGVPGAGWPPRQLPPVKPLGILVRQNRGFSHRISLLVVEERQSRARHVFDKYSMEQMTCRLCQFMGICVTISSQSN